ncbi:MAG: hypothetical protein LBK03_05170 [Bacteroidales bacterium]|jgi:hypothetical protein|nr:hypothetical protein [Bacteroidales bacterium]
MKIEFKKWLPHVIAVSLFLILTLTYFSPYILENKDIPQGDIASSRAWGVDLRDYHEKTGEYAYWSNTMFSGMPANYTYSPPIFNVFNYIGKVLVLNMPGLHIGIVFLYLLGFYIFLLALGCKPWLSILGAIAYAFASYNFIIIDAGHVSKGWAMGTMAPVLGGIILCYRKKYLLGALITLVFTGMHIAYNHQQITYYLLIIIAFVALTYLVYAIKDRTLKDYFKASAILVLIGGLAVMPMLGRLIPTMDYTKETMRGGAVLQNNPDGEKEGTGLNIDYAFQWSYGKMETMTLLIPNFYGGSSHYNIGQDSESYKKLRGSGKDGNLHAMLPCIGVTSRLLPVLFMRVLLSVFSSC